MKTFLLAILLTATTVYNSSAVSVSLQKGMWGNINSSNGDKGTYKVTASTGMGDGQLDYDVIANELVLEVPTYSNFYSSLDGGYIEYDGDCYLPDELSEALGFGEDVVYVPAGMYSISEQSDGTRVVRLQYAFD